MECTKRGHIHRWIILAALVACLVIQGVTIVTMNMQIDTLNSDMAQVRGSLTQQFTTAIAAQEEQLDAVLRQIEEQDRLIGELERMINYSLDG